MSAFVWLDYSEREQGRMILPWRAFALIQNCVV